MDGDMPVFVLAWFVGNPDRGAFVEFDAFKVTADVSGADDLNLEIESGRDGCLELVDATFDAVNVPGRPFPRGKPMPSVSGYVKWDGCSNITVLPDHFCGAEEIRRLAALLLHCYKLAAENIGGWDGGEV